MHVIRARQEAGGKREEKRIKEDDGDRRGRGSKRCHDRRLLMDLISIDDGFQDSFKA
jgi:hypothetical protein